MALKIERGVQDSPVACVIHGVEGIGKTTLASQFPSPVILDTEEGSKRIDCARVRIKDWLALMSAMLDLAGDPQGFKTVVIDSIDWAEQLLRLHLEKKLGKPVDELPYGRGFGVLSEAFQQLINAADQLIDKGLHVVFVGHSEVKRCSPPDMDEGYDRYEIKLSKKVAPIVKEWADLILFTNYKTRVVEGSDGRKKATGGKTRIMYAERSAAWDAKNRFGLPAEMPMAIAELAPALKSQTLAETIAAHVAAATTVAQLGKFGDRIDALVSEDKLTAEEWSRLTDAIAARHEELEPTSQEVGHE
jgi:hypothetical protein